jgi:hypothetical protein
MRRRYLSPLVTLVVSNLLRNLNEVKANIQMQKTGATAIYPSISQLPASDMERWKDGGQPRFLDGKIPSCLLSS